MARFTPGFFEIANSEEQTISFIQTCFLQLTPPASRWASKNAEETQFSKKQLPEQSAARQIVSRKKESD